MLSHGGAFILGMIVALLGHSIFADDWMQKHKKLVEYAIQQLLASQVAHEILKKNGALEQTANYIKKDEELRLKEFRQYCEHSGSKISDFPPGQLAELYNKTLHAKTNEMEKALQKHQPRKHGRFTKKSS